MELKYSFLAILFFCAIVVQQNQVNGEQCESSTYPPDKKDKIEWHVVDLDSPAEQRWMELASKKRREIANLISVVKNFTRFFFKDAIIHFVDKDLSPLVDKLPSPYADEIKGIANATNIPLGEIVLYNIFYEVTSLCTTIVAQDKSGEIFHVRNLDFGLFFGWDVKKNDWSLTEKLRPLVVNVDFQRGGKSVYRAVTFVGYVGIITGVKPGVVSVTLNQRFSTDGGYIGLIEWVLGLNDAKFISLLVRDTLEMASSYRDAVHVLSEPQLIGPVYYIVGGVKPADGCVITRSREKTLNIMSLNATSNTWYVVETNYDNWHKAPADDDRRDAAKQCLNKTAQQHISFSTLYDVLSTKPVRNKATAYTALIRPRTGHVESYLRYCPNPCPLS